MIDTVGFSVKISKYRYDKILEKSKEYSEFDHKENKINYRVLRADVPIGSFDNKITLKCYTDGVVRFECSLPKRYYANNIQLLYPSQLEQALSIIQNVLRYRFGYFPSFHVWSIERVDLCYAWKFPEKTTVEEILTILKTFDYPRKIKYTYIEAVMWRGRSYSLKFYLKEKEFLKHDFRELCKRTDNSNYAYNLLKLSEGVLRYEITFRKTMVKKLFSSSIKGRITYVNLLNEEYLIKILNHHLNLLFSNLDRKATNDRDVLSKLKCKYPRKKAIRLFEFYNLYYSKKEYDRKLEKDNYHPTTIWRKKRDLVNAGVGIPQSNIPFPFTLDIPSPLTINDQNVPRLRL